MDAVSTWWLILSAIIIWLFLLPAILRWLWNMTMPQVFDWRSITYWQAFRLILIIAILGAGFRLGS